MSALLRMSSGKLLRTTDDFFIHLGLHHCTSLYTQMILYFFNIFFKYFIYLFLEKGKEKERERNINVWLPLTCPHLGNWSETQAYALTGN